MGFSLLMVAGRGSRRSGRRSGPEGVHGGLEMVVSPTSATMREFSIAATNQAEKTNRKRGISKSQEGMAERPPSQPMVAWEEVGAPRESSSPAEPDEVCVVQPLRPDACWLAVYQEEQESVDFIQAFLKSLVKEEAERMRFLDCICDICRTAREKVLLQGLDLFCQGFELAESIQVLLEEEPRDHLRTKVRQKAMHAITELSSVGTVLEGKEESLRDACFSSVFLLPAVEEMGELEAHLLFQTLFAMDTMLKTLVLNSPASRVSEELRDIFQALLNFADTERVRAQERPLWRVAMLSSFLADHPTLEAWCRSGRDICGPVCYRDIQIPILGELLGHLLLFRFSTQQTSYPAVVALRVLYEFISKQKGRSLRNDEAGEVCKELEKVSLMIPPYTGGVSMQCADCLKPAEKADVVLVAIEATRDSCAFDREAARRVLDVVMRYPDFWLAGVDVPTIMRGIHENLDGIKTHSSWQSVVSLLRLLTEYSMQAARSLSESSAPGDSAGMAVGEAMLSTPQTSEESSEQLPSQRRDVELHSRSEDVADESHIESNKRHEILVTVSQFLGDLIALSERPEMARKMRVLLPHIKELFQEGDPDIRMKALQCFRNVMGHLERREASPIAVALVEELLPLFDDASSGLRELSMCLFRDLVESVVRRDKEKMKNYVQSALVPLFFHMSDQTHSVAKVQISKLTTDTEKDHTGGLGIRGTPGPFPRLWCHLPASAALQASGEALLAVAELLKWKRLKHLVRTEQTWRIGECLLEQDRSRAEEYCHRSLPYLQDAQETLREAAVRFIGLAARPLRDQSMEKVSELCSALRILENDSSPAIRSLAAQTILILSSPREQPRSRHILRALCCWCC